MNKVGRQIEICLSGLAFFGPVAALLSSSSTGMAATLGKANPFVLVPIYCILTVTNWNLFIHGLEYMILARDIGRIKKSL